MKKILFVLVTLFSILASQQEAKASHAAGGELTYEALGGATYKFRLKFYRDCTGISEPDSFYMCYFDSCTSTYYKKTLAKVGFLPNGDPNGTAVSTGCSAPTTCQNTSSTIKGFEEWWYEGTVTLTNQCSKWAFWVCESARNNQNNVAGTGGAGFNLYIIATLDNLSAQGNNSANFSFKPVPYMCLNQPWSYNNGAYDVDGDSLSFKSITPYSSNTTTSSTGACNGSYPPGQVGPAAGFGTYNPVINPFPSTFFALNTSTGIVNSVPTAQGIYVLTIEVTEWRNGLKIGTILRDIQMAVVSCNIITPSSNIPVGTLNNLTLNPLTGYYAACVGVPIDFCVLITGAIDTAVITAINNIPFVLPGSNTTTIGTGTDSVLICGAWTPTALDTGLHVVTIQYQDTSCLYNPIGIINAFTLPIFVPPVTDGLGDTTICLGAQAQLGAVGGTSFTWSVISGTPNSLSCTNCSNPIVSPIVNTKYLVTSNFASVCGDAIDTVEVLVEPKPIVNAGPDAVICVGNSYSITATASSLPGVNLTYKWNPATSLNNANILSPTVVNAQSTTAYVLTVTPNGIAVCATKDTMILNVLTGMHILNNDTTICEGDQVFISTIGSASYNYTWSPTAGVSNINDKNATLTPLVNTSYTLTASFPGCIDTSETINVDVEFKPKVKLGPDRVICNYDTVRMSPSIAPIITTPNFYKYVWAPKKDLNDSTIIDPAFDGHVNSTYTLTVTTPKGCVGKDTITIQVLPTDFLQPMADKNLCPGQTASLTAVGGAQYVWQPGIWVNDSTAANVVANPVATTIYTLYGTDVNGCKDTQKVEVFVAPNAILFTGPDVTIYPGNSEQLFAQGNCSNYAWAPAIGLNFANISNPIAGPSVSTQYVVTGSTEYNCTTTDTITVNVSNQSLINMPNAFAPGGPGNGLLKADRLGSATLQYFRVYDRWGLLVFETTDINNGWDGKLNGVPQPIGTYVYQIDAIDNAGKHFIKNGNVTLLR